MNRFLCWKEWTVVLSLFWLLGCDGGGGGDSSTPDSGNGDADDQSAVSVYLVMGDGISTGIGLPAGEAAWPDRLKNLLKRKVYNEAKSHSRVGYGVSMADYFMATHNPSHLLVLYGSNDVGVEENSDYIVGQLLAIVQKAKARSVVPVVATLPPITGRDYDMISRLQRVNAKIRAMADAEGIALADVAAEFGDGEGLLLSDGLHPTGTGQEIIAQTFYDVL